MAEHNSRIPKWVWITTPALVLAFIGFVLYLSSVPASQDLPSVKEQAKRAFQRENVPVAQQPEPPKMNFEFYRMLEQKKVEVPEVEVYRSTPRDASTQYEFRLQAGSFRSEQDAERMRAELLLEGLTAYRQPVEVNGNPWHRVMVGPFTDRSAMSRAQDVLASKNISAMVVRQPVVAP
ncbi:MAG: SPOR domain-containing protein [Bacterioplanes sp.]|nr:SPOR domain-containing protein [Bacterioplanes sp.]